VRGLEGHVDRADQVAQHGVQVDGLPQPGGGGRYFSTATPTQTGSTASPRVPTTCQYEEPPEACALMTADTTSATAPL
jgi:hypothetical protein